MSELDEWFGERPTTDEYIQTKRQQAHPKTRQDWSNPAEAMVKRILEGAFGAANVQPTIDRIQTVIDGDGRPHSFYSNFGVPDYTFAVQVGDRLMEGWCEVKCISPASKGLDMTDTNLKQLKFYRKKPKDKLKWWAFVLWVERGEARVFVFDNDRLLKLKQQLLDRAHNPEEKWGRFEGLSLRRRYDLGLLADCEVVKVSGRWTIPEGHWFHADLR